MVRFKDDSKKQIFLGENNFGMLEGITVLCTCGVSWVTYVNGSGLTMPPGGLQGLSQLVQV